MEDMDMSHLASSLALSASTEHAIVDGHPGHVGVGLAVLPVHHGHLGCRAGEGDPPLSGGERPSWRTPLSPLSCPILGGEG